MAAQQQLGSLGDLELSCILDRDQRTVRSRTQCTRTSEHSSDKCQCNNTTTTTTQPPTQRYSTTTRTWRIAQRLKRVLVCTVWILSVEYLCVAGAPTHSLTTSMEDRMNQHPKWVNPCGASGQPGDVVHDGSDAVSVSDRELVDQIVLTANIALNYANTFRDKYVQTTFHQDFNTQHQMWKGHQDWPWMPKIPKELGEDATAKHLESIELDEALKDAYQYLQMVAVGLEQLVWDQDDEGGAFLSQFQKAESHLNALLCEIQVALLERRTQPRPDVRRDIMDERYRKTTTTARSLRDWLIFRELINALEYTVQVFKFLLDSAKLLPTD